MTNRTIRATTATVVIAAATLLLTACPNELFEEISEDVLVESAGGRPEITDQVPAPGATDVLSATSVEVAFNMPLADDAIDHLAVTTGGADPQPVEGEIRYETDTNALVFQPAEPLEVETRYTVSVSEELKNAGGASMGEGARWGFDTTLVNPDQFRFDIDMSKMDIDLSTYRTYLSVQSESSVSDSPFGGDIYGGEFGSQHSFLIDPAEIGAGSSEKLVVAVMVLASEIVEDDSADFGISFDLSKDRLVWYGYQGTMGDMFPSSSQLDGVGIDYGAGGIPRGISKSDPGSDQLAGMANDTTIDDFFFERGVVHTLQPEDAFFRLNYQEIQGEAVPLTLGDEQRIEVPDRYGFSAFTFSSTDGGAYSFDYYRDSIDNRDTYSQLWLFERNGATYIPVEVDSDRAVTEDFAPSFDPYTRNGQFGNGIAWQVGAESNDTTLSLSSDTEYLLIADSWLHLPATGDGQIDSGSFRIRVNGP